MFVSTLRNPRKVLTIDGCQEEHIISLLFYLHSMKRTHEICKTILCFGTLRFDVNELFFHSVFKNLEFDLQPQQRYSRGTDGCLSSTHGNKIPQDHELQSREVVPSNQDPHI